jgi:hypothetical protein
MLSSTGGRRDLDPPRVDFNRVGPGSPIRQFFDLDSGDTQVALADIALGQCPEPQARLFVSGNKGASFRFLKEREPVQQVTVKAGDTARLVVDRRILDEAAAKGIGSVVLTGQIVRQLRERNFPAPLEVVIDLFRSGPPKVAVSFQPVATLEADVSPPADGHVVLGRLEIAPEQSGILSAGHARLTLSTNLLLSGEAHGNASLRASRLKQNPDDHVWQQTDVAFTDELVLDPVEGRFEIDGVDVGIDYSLYRDWLRDCAADGGAQQRIDLQLQVVITALNDPSRVLLDERFPSSVDVAGTLSETITLELSDAVTLARPVMPMLLSLSARSEDPASYALPPVRARRVDDGHGFELAPLTLRVTYDGFGTASLDIAYGLRIDQIEQPMACSDPIELGPAETANARLDVARLFEDAGDLEGEVLCSVSVGVRRTDPHGGVVENRFVFDLPVEFPAVRPDWLACVDFGTSSTAVWIGRNGGDRAGMQLPLGQWLQRIDPLHDESVWWKASDAPPEARISYLLPSHVGLSPQINLRADYDPLSLGNLSLSLPGDVGALARMRHLDRTYDVSVPFPSRQLMADHIETIVTEPKRRMIGRADHVRLNSDVLMRDGDQLSRTRRVDLARLVADCFAEIGGYVAQCALTMDLDQPRSAPPGRYDVRERRKALTLTEDIDQARLDPATRFGVVVTHPSGIDRKRAAIYRTAGLRFLEQFCAAKGHPPRQGDVHLIGEALAAARFGIQQYLDDNELPREGEDRAFITLDIGAGTYDVTVIETRLLRQAPVAWSVRSHFGLAFGGSELDRALADRIAGILSSAAKMPEIARLFEIETDLPQSTAEMWHLTDRQRRVGLRFLSELHGAKARLTDQLLSDPAGDYAWRPQADGGPAFDMKVGIPGSDTEWPVQLKARSPSVSTPAVFPIPGTGAELVVERDASGASIRLRMSQEAFAHNDAAERDHLTAILSLAGVELPRLAWLEYKRRCGAYQEHGGTPVWIVTGRAALWPPLFNAIKETISGFGPDGGTTVRAMPFSPDDMKRAVVNGAIQLAQEPWADAEWAVYNPIALIKYRLSAGLTGEAGAGRKVAEIVRIIDDDGPAPVPKVVRMTAPFAIARIVPCLDEPEGREARIELFNQLGLRPWDELGTEVTGLQQSGPAIAWTISARRDLSGWHVSCDPGRENGPSFTFGPLKEGRVYGGD